MTDGQIEKKKTQENDIGNTIRSSCMKFYPILSKVCGETASDERTDRQDERKEGQTHRQTDGQTKQRLYARPNGKHNNYILLKVKLFQVTKSLK